MSKTVIIADDHPFTIEGMEQSLLATPELDVIGTAKNGIEAIALIKRLKPDCAILDLSMPGANGLEVFNEAKRWSPDTRVAIVTGISAAALFKQLFEAGIDGLFVKNTSPDIIRTGIVRVCNGERVISDDALQAIKLAEKDAQLSNRELEVLRAIAAGQNNKQIAQSLNLSPKTIDNHRTNLMRKLNVNSTASLLVKAIKLGLIDVS